MFPYIRHALLASVAGLAMLFAAPDSADAQYGYWTGYGYSPYTTYYSGYAPVYTSRTPYSYSYTYVPFSYYRGPAYGYYDTFSPYAWGGGGYYGGWGYPRAAARLGPLSFTWY